MIKKNERYQSYDAALLLMLLCITIFGWIIYAIRKNETLYQRQLTIERELPDLIDIQKQLNAIEPENPIEEDGIYGPKTKEKWERVYCNEQAKKYFSKGENQ